MIDPNFDIVPTLRMFNGAMMDKAADEIEHLRKEVAKLKAIPRAAEQAAAPVAPQDIETMRAAFEKARPAVKKFHYEWDAARSRYLLDGDEDRGQYIQNEFAEWCEAWCAALQSALPRASEQADEAVMTDARRWRWIMAHPDYAGFFGTPEIKAIDAAIAIDAARAKDRK